MSNVNSVEQMMDSFDILADLPFTLKKVEELKWVASNLDGVDKIINNQIKKIEETWQGNAANAMKDRLTQASNTNKMLVDEINGVANRIKTVVENVYEADMASVQSIQNMGK